MKEFQLQNNVTLRYLDLAGEGIPIVFVHGLGCSSSFDYPQVACSGKLANHRRILVDLVGSGYSDKPEQYDYTISNHAKSLQSLLTHLDINEFIIFGHSMGGAVSIVLASLTSDKVKALILSEANLDSGGGFFSRKIANYSEGDFANRGYKEVIQESISSGNSQWATGLENSSPIAIYKNSVSLIEGQSPSWRQVYYSLEIPKTYIYGSHSLPDPDYDELAQNGINVVIVDDAGHSMAWENPIGLALAIEQSINKLNKLLKSDG